MNTNEERVLKLYKQLKREMGVPPTLHQVAKAGGWNNRQSIHRYVKSLAEQGKLRKTPRGYVA